MDDKKPNIESLRNAVSKGAEQAESGEFSKHTVSSLLEELNQGSSLLEEEVRHAPNNQST